MNLPELPETGALRVLVIAASTSLVAIMVSLVLEIRQKRWRSSARCSAALVVACASGFLARPFPGVHVWATLAVLFLLVFNASRSRGFSVTAQIVAAVTWGVALICARILF